MRPILPRIESCCCCCWLVNSGWEGMPQTVRSRVNDAHEPESEKPNSEGGGGGGGSGLSCCSFGSAMSKEKVGKMRRTAKRGSSVRSVGEAVEEGGG